MHQKKPYALALTAVSLAMNEAPYDAITKGYYIEKYQPVDINGVLTFRPGRGKHRTAPQGWGTRQRRAAKLRRRMGAAHA